VRAAIIRQFSFACRGNKLPQRLTAGRVEASKVGAASARNYALQPAAVARPSKGKAEPGAASNELNYFATTSENWRPSVGSEYFSIHENRTLYAFVI
jgi:hypothetical protein